jgi:hypothetical protein
MEPKVIAFVNDKRYERRAREQETLDAMFTIYCDHHHYRRGSVCPECGELSEYARRRLERCVFGDAKPTCANCVVHCYRDDMRERIREVMRFAGPRMLSRHPLLGILHLWDGRRPTPRLPEKAQKPA